MKGVAEAPKLPADIIRAIPKPEGLSEEEKTALHNVTSALCNRKQIRDVVEEAVMGTCIALRVPMPDKTKKGGKSKAKEMKETEGTKGDERGKSKEEQAGGGEDDEVAIPEREEGGEEGEQSNSEVEPEPVLLKRKRDKATIDEEELGSDEDEDKDEVDDQPFEGFSDSDAEERVWSRYDDFVAGSSESDDSDEDGSDAEDDFVDSRARSIRKPTTTSDDISLSSVDSEPEPEPDSDPEISGSDSSTASASLPKPKKAKTGPISTGGSAFLPTLMGGYISGSESDASDIDVGPSARKNRRGQRARQAIWEKKYKEKAKHVQKQQETKGRDQGWDMRRGAVGDDEDGGGNKPWKKGIRNPFDNRNIHPDRQQHVSGGGEDGGGGGGFRDMPEKPKVPPSRDDTGPLHPSWAAAKKAKEEGQKIAFQGRKVVFD